MPVAGLGVALATSGLILSVGFSGDSLVSHAERDLQGL